MSIISGHTTRAVGTVLTASIYNEDHLNHISNASTLNTDKMEGTPPPVVDGHAVVWNGVGGNALRTAGFFPVNKAGDTTGPMNFASNTRILKIGDPDGGGRLLLERSSSSSLAFDVVIDLTVNTIRIYEGASPFKGVYIDINACAASVATALWHDNNYAARVAALSGGGTVNYLRADGAFAAPPSQIYTRAYGEYTANTSLVVAIPLDDTIPQNTEGTEILNVSITPSNAANRVRATFTGFVSGSADVSQFAIAALFRDSIAGALIATTVKLGDERSEWVEGEIGQNVSFYRATTEQITFTFEHSPGTTSATTYRVRVGGNNATAIRMNGSIAGRFFGGVAKATLTLQELPA